MSEIISQITWVDFLVAMLCIRGLYVGYKSGLFPELLRITSYLVTAVAAFWFQRGLTNYLTMKTFLNESSAKFLSLVGLLIVFFAVTKVATMLILKFLKLGEGGGLYRALGMVLGVLRWCVLLSILFMVIDYLPFSGLKNDIHEKSVTGSRIAAIAPTAFEYLSKIAPSLEIQRPS